MISEPRSDELEGWAEKLREAFGDAAPGTAAPAVVTGDDGLSRYRTDELWQEVTYLGYHLHWDLATLLDLEHHDRRMLVTQVVELNQRAWDEVRSRG